MSLDIVARNHVKIYGSGSQPMMFAHGFGCDQNMWRFVAPAFENDYKTILFDYVGSGGSDLSAFTADKYASLSGYAQDVLDICEALNLSKVIFVGHSVSGMIGVLAANRRPDLFDRLILIGPSPRYINDLPEYFGGFEHADIEGLLDLMEKNYIGWANYLAPIIMQNPENPELTEELETSFCSTDPKTARTFAEATFFSDNREDLTRVTVPSLVLQCSEDVIAPQEVGEYVHHNLRGSEFRLMQATGHCPHVSHPAETIELIREYLGRPATSHSAASSI